MACFSSEVYYKVKQQRRAITEMGYNGSAIEFNRYEKQYPSLMRLARYK